MIDRLKNCPNCGGILNEAGRCQYCGSKVYDFMAIDFTNEPRNNAKSFIRIRTNTKDGIKTIIAPISVSNVSMTSHPTMVLIPSYEDYYCELFDKAELKRVSCDTRLTIECMVIDNQYMIMEDPEA